MKFIFNYIRGNWTAVDCFKTTDKSYLYTGLGETRSHRVSREFAPDGKDNIQLIKATDSVEMHSRYNDILASRYKAYKKLLNEEFNNFINAFSSQIVGYTRLNNKYIDIILNTLTSLDEFKTRLDGFITKTSGQIHEKEITLKTFNIKLDDNDPDTLSIMFKPEKYLYMSNFQNEFNDDLAILLKRLGKESNMEYKINRTYFSMPTSSTPTFTVDECHDGEGRLVCPISAYRNLTFDVKFTNSWLYSDNERTTIDSVLEQFKGLNIPVRNIQVENIPLSSIGGIFIDDDNAYILTDDGTYVRSHNYISLLTVIESSKKFDISVDISGAAIFRCTKDFFMNYIGKKDSGLSFTNMTAPNSLYKSLIHNYSDEYFISQCKKSFTRDEWTSWLLMQECK